MKNKSISLIEMMNFGGENPVEHQLSKKYPKIKKFLNYMNNRSFYDWYLNYNNYLSGDIDDKSIEDFYRHTNFIMMNLSEILDDIKKN